MLGASAASGCGAAARAGRGDAIRVVTSRQLGAKRFLTLVEVDGERLLLGLTGEHVALVRAGVGVPAP